MRESWRVPVVGLAVFVLLSPSSALAGDAPSFARQQWTVRDGLPVNSITGILQSADGYLWLSTFDGLVRFDGARFVVLNTSTSPGLPSNRIVDLIEAADGTMFVATEDRRLVRYARGEFSAEPASIAVRRLEPDGEGGIWVGTSAGLLHYTNGILTPVAASQVTTPIEAIARDRHGAIWCGGAQGLHRIAGGTVTTWTAADGLSSSEVTAILESGDGSMLVGTHAGLDRFSSGSFTRLGHAGGILRAHVFALHRSGDDRAWVGTDLGLFALSAGRLTEGRVGKGPSYLRTVRRFSDGRTWSTFGGAIYRGEQLVHDAGARVTTMVEDREGSLWIGTDGRGLHRLRPSMLAVLGADEGLADDNVYPVFEDSRGAIWTGMSDAGVARIHDGVVTNFGRANGWPLLARTFAEDRDGRLHIGMLSGGVCVVDGPAFNSCVKIGDTEFRQSSVYAMAFDRAGTLWIGTERGLYRRTTEGAWGFLSPADGLPHGTIRVVKPADDGTVWIGTNGGGVALIDGSRVSVVSVEHGLTSNLVRAIHIDREKSVWVGTEDRGLNRLTRRADGQGWTVAGIRRADGLYDDVIHQILEDDQERFWMTTNRGIFGVERRALDAFASGDRRPLFSIAFNERDGMRNREANGGVQPAGVRARDGRMWFPTQAGLVILDPRRLTRNERQPPVVIEQVRHAGRTLSGLLSNIRLPLGTRELEIDYAALSFVAPENIRFEYRLEGLDERPTEAGNRRTAYFTNLPPGHYLFRVAAANSDGVWNRGGASVAIEVPPLFYETNWFRAAAALALVLAVAAVLRIRVRRLTARQKELEAIVALRTRDLAEANRAKDRFLAVVSHEVRTPLNGILGVVRLLLRSRLSTTQAEWAGIVQGQGQVLLRIINDILDSAKIQASGVQLDPDDFSVRDLFDAVVRSHREAATDRPIRFDLRIDPRVPDWVHGDPVRVRQVLDNLLAIAATFTEHGSIVVRLGCLNEAPGTRPGDAVDLGVEVQDSGPGVPPQARERLFLPFSQVDMSATRRRGGTGLGLSIARSIVEAMAGAIGHADAPGGGSIFWFRIQLYAADPVSAARPADAPSLASLAGRTGTRPRVLIGEDNPINQLVALSLLEEAGCDVVATEDGVELVEAFAAARPDLILVDCEMPDMDGYMAAAEIRRIERGHSRVPIVALTAHAFAGERDRCLAAGMDDVLTKPLDPERLAAALRVLAVASGRARGPAPQIGQQAFDFGPQRAQRRLSPGELTVARVALDPRRHLDARLIAKRLQASLETMSGRGRERRIALRRRACHRVELCRTSLEKRSDEPFGNLLFSCRADFYPRLHRRPRTRER